MHTHFSKHQHLRSRIASQLIVCLAVVFILGGVPLTAYAATSAWSPTLLVNTESFQVIDEGDSTTDIQIKFGGTVNEHIYWDRTNAQFRFTDDIRVDGNITGSGTLTVSGDIKTKADLTINSDAGAADAVLTFGSDGTNETAKFLNTEDRFEFSDDLRVVNDLSASGTLSIEGAASLQSTLSVVGSVTTNGDLTLNNEQGAADTILTFGSDSTNETLTFKNNEDRFEFSDDVNVTGGLYASGSLIVAGDSRFKGDLVINSDSGAADTILTFGSDSTNETVKFLNAEDRFELSDDLRATGGIGASGGLVVDGAAVFKSTLSLNGVAYTFPSSDGTASGKVLKTDSAGQLSWSTDSTATTPTRNSGSMIFLNPEYPNSIYFQSGASTSAVGTLGTRYDSGSAVNFYRWQSTRTSSQNYWIISRVRIPDQFSGWQNTKPIEFKYRSSGGWLEMRALDTSNNPITLSSHTKLSNADWTTATITGPEVSGAFASGGYITLMVKMVSSGAAITDRAYADASWINLNIETKN